MFALRHVNTAIWYARQSTHIHYKQIVQLTRLAKIWTQIMDQGEEFLLFCEDRTELYGLNIVTVGAHSCPNQDAS